MIDYVDEAAAEFDRLFAAIDDAGPDVAVPSCPGWTIADLTNHVRGTQRWVEAMVRRGARVRFREVTEDVSPSQLVETLRAADPDAEIWTFGHDQHVRYWQRRMLAEALMHRVDVELALGRTPEIDPAVAADAIEELLDNLTAFAWLAEQRAGLAPAGETIHLHASDSDGEWLVEMAGSELNWSRTHAKASAAATGPGGALLMLLYGRISPADPQLTVFGDTQLLASWQEHAKF